MFSQFLTYILLKIGAHRLGGYKVQNAFQVSTNTGIISRKVNLEVVSPVAFILGGDEYHIDRGSQISLVCVIEKAPTPPQ